MSIADLLVPEFEKECAVTQDEVDFAPRGGSASPGYSDKPTPELLAIFDKGVADGVLPEMYGPTADSRKPA